MARWAVQCHLVKALPYWLLFRQRYCNAYLCLIFLLKEEEVKDIANQRRTLKVIPPENENDYTRYYLDSLRSERKIEVFVLKSYLKEKLKIEFAPRTEIAIV